jgi:Amt family ammonium transporter
MTPDEATALAAAIAGDPEDGLLTQSNGDQIWILLCGFLVFWMHAGFSMLECGSVRHKNAVNILFKNIATVAIGGIMYYLVGYAFAYGTDNFGKKSYSFIGSGNYALSQVENTDFSSRHTWFFQYAFAATGATIVSGAVAGRVNLMAYFLTAMLMTGFTYPVVSHWIWATDGWASAFRSDVETYPPPFFDVSKLSTVQETSPNVTVSVDNGQLTFTTTNATTEVLVSDQTACGMIDYAGSGVVHMTGGIAAFWGALVLGPRSGRFTGGEDIRPHNITMQTLGVFILWFGWFGFNCGSTLAFDGPVASQVAVTTTLAPSMAVITSVAFSMIFYGHFDIGFSLNSALAGLVSITAGCSVVPDWAAIIIGFIGCFVYVGWSKLMILMKVDDPVDAVAVHGACGVWGCLAVGIFAEGSIINLAYGAVPGCTFVGNANGFQFATQLVGVLAIIAWVTLIMLPFFFALKACNFLRVPIEHEEQGLDVSEHGGHSAFTADKTLDAKTNASETAPPDAEAGALPTADAVATE